MVIKSKRANENIILSRFVASYFLFSAINISIKLIFSIPMGLWRYISILMAGGLILIGVSAVPILLVREGINLLICELIIGLMFAFSFTMGYANSSSLKTSMFWSMFVGLPLGLSVKAIDEPQTLLDTLHKYSFAQSIPLWISLLQMRDIGDYSMSASYSLLLPVIIQIYYSLKHRSLLDLVFALIGTALIVVFGARGPSVSLIFFFIFELVFVVEQNNYTKILSVGMVVLSSMFYVYYDQFLARISYFLRVSGIRSYSLSKLVDGTLAQSTSRSYLRQYYWNLVKEKPLFGWGIKGGWIANGFGPHNTLLELLLAFGILIGGGLCFISILCLIRTFTIKKGTFKELLAIFAAYNFTMYSVMGNWTQKPQWFIFVILALSYKQKKEYIRDSRKGYYDNYFAN